MARPLRDSLATTQDAPIDPDSVERAYRLHRARRRARIERARARRNARIRFWLVIIVMIAGTVYLSLAVWHKVEQLFGL